ncbi:LysR family transcriptional regulator [Vibrio marisflavi]|uniref:PCP degradation transcriptional activation protein n=1 Tax=Vibrio marisflavi CECT 7928 TaxID=634439 RepID=A0ABN8E6H6_9VIBR|nr:LysR family transcriptional regulator [Vibrio marisflavi]CAH0541179.1 PCP degradation transcriptional activation protein [Vibrio marisflavi CECT 7928]
MQNYNWKGVDLNLLVSFQALYQTHSVSEAAKRCYVSQSAMSHSLQRLRVLFDDLLFQRVASSMQPTQRAHNISSYIDQILATIQHDLLKEKPFSAQEFDGVWRIGLTDYAEQLFAAPIYDCLNQRSAQSQVSFIHVDRSNYTRVAKEQQLDLIIGSITDLNSEFTSEHLYQEEHVCLYDPVKLVFQNPMTLEEFVQVEHALVSPDGALATAVDNKLNKLGQKRRVAASSRNFLTVQRLVIGRKMICIVPKRSVSNTLLSCVKPPVDVPNFDIELIYYKSQENSPKSTWLREQIAAVIHTVAQ